MEALLGGLLQNDDPRAQALLGELIGSFSSLLRPCSTLLLTTNRNHSRRRRLERHVSSRSESCYRIECETREIVETRIRSTTRSASFTREEGTSSVEPTPCTSNPSFLPLAASFAFTQSKRFLQSRGRFRSIFFFDSDSSCCRWFSTFPDELVQRRRPRIQRSHFLRFTPNRSTSRKLSSKLSFDFQHLVESPRFHHFSLTSPRPILLDYSRSIHPDPFSQPRSIHFTPPTTPTRIP